MGKIAIVSVLIGERHKNIANLTHATQIEYAKKCGADYLVYDSTSYHVTHPDGLSSTIISNNPAVPRDINDLAAPAFGAYNKLNIVELLDYYDRILHIDTDIIVRKDAPSLFEMVPEDKIGIVSESDFIEERDRGGLMLEWAERNGIELENWSKRYYNTGVFLFSQGHRRMLDVSGSLYDDSFYEQTMINMNIHLNQLEVYELDPKFNRMTFMDGILLMPRHDAYFIHYGGSWMMLKEGHSVEANFLTKLIKYDLEKWEKDFPEYKYKKRATWTRRSFWVRD